MRKPKLKAEIQRPIKNIRVTGGARGKGHRRVATVTFEFPDGTCRFMDYHDAEQFGLELIRKADAARGLLVVLGLSKKA